MTKNKDMKKALSDSLKSEEKAIHDRFQKADSVLSAAPVPDAPKTGKVIKDTFTFPETDYQLIAKIRNLLLLNAVAVSKSEVIRAGLNALDKLSAEELKELFGNLVKVKTGRPK